MILLTQVQFGGWDQDLLSTAHNINPTIKVLSEFGWACLPSQPCDWIANHSAAEEKARAAVALAIAREADGINIDIEGAGQPSCKAIDLTNLVQAIRRAQSQLLPQTKRHLIINVNAFPNAISPQAGNAYNL